VCFSGYQRRLRIWETNFGRDAGWIAERDGRPVAVLTEPRWEEMFWDSYCLEIIADDPQVRDAMLAEAFWRGNGWVGLAWRNREFGDLAESAFPAIDAFPAPGRLTMRGLYIPLDSPGCLDWIVLWVRRQWRKHRAESGMA
jgi:hypothetical protein